MSQPQSMKERYILVLNLINNNETEKALRIAEDTIAEDPENGEGYVLLGQYYSLTGQLEDAKTWMEKAIEVEPENVFVFQSVIRFYQQSQTDKERWRELTKVGLEQSPDDAFYHYQFGLAYFYDDNQAGLKHIQEAAHMDPHNSEYLAVVANLGFILRKWDLYETYEQRTLEEDPENANYLMLFADYAYRRGKFNKAIHFIKEAIRIEQDNKQIRDKYQQIYPASNSFVRLKRKTNRLLIGFFTLPYRFLKLKDTKHPYLELFSIFVVMFAILFTALFALTGKYTFYIFSGFIVWSIISGRVGKTVLDKVGFKRSLEKSLESQNDYKQRKAILEMKRNLGVSADASVSYTESSAASLNTADSLEEELATIWGTDAGNMEEIKAKQEELKAAAKTKAPIGTKKETRERKPSPHVLEYPKKETNYGGVIVVIVVLVIGISLRSYPYFDAKINRPEPIDEELQESIRETSEAFSQERTDSLKQSIDSILESTDTENEEHVDQFLQILKEDEFNLQELQALASSEIVEHLETNWDASYVEQLANASVTAIEYFSDSSSGSKIYITNEVGDFEAVIAMEDSKIQSIYVDGWDNSEAYQEEMQESLEAFKE